MSEFERAGAVRLSMGMENAEVTPAGGPERLTPKELEVLARIVSGHTLREIGDLLGVSRNTVHFHVKNIYGKWRVSTRAEATLRAARLGLVAL